MFTIVILIITFVPYLIGEIYNDFENSAAILANISQENITNHLTGIKGGKNALDSLFHNYKINFSFFNHIYYNSIETWKVIFLILIHTKCPWYFGI